MIQKLLARGLLAKRLFRLVHHPFLTSLSLLASGSMTFTVRQAQIVGLFFETFLYGINFIIFGVCLRCLLWDHNGSVLGQVKRGFLAISVALFIISTLDITLAVVNDYDGLMSPGSQDTLNTPVWLTISRVNLSLPYRGGVVAYAALKMVLVGIQNLIGGSIWASISRLSM